MNAVSNRSNDDKVLHCWKEIATYLSAGVRTVQRWESEFSLPVRRPRGTKRSAVLAFSSEIDEWIRNLPVALAACTTSGVGMDRLERSSFPPLEAMAGAQMGESSAMPSHP